MPTLTTPVETLQSLFYGVAPDNGDKKLWSVADSSHLYRVQGWGAPYFCINENGHMAVRPHGDSTRRSEEIDILHVVERAVREGMSPPFLIRFENVLHHRLASLHAAFERGILLQGYHGKFQGVFPVKCNPDRYIVEGVVKHGKAIRFGLEAGSKPEVMMAMAVLCGHGHSESLLICNGYKDREYVHVALLARRLGIRSVIVLEQDEELELVLDVSERLGIQPIIGVRAKLSTKHDGHWGETSGENGKFGLTTPEIVAVVTKLRRTGKLNCLQLLHFHIGSQIPSLELVDEGVSEAAHIFCELSIMGANMKCIDIGGGLGVDYNGSHSSTSEASIGYTLDGYAEQVVSSIMVACALKQVNCPTITCESGRGLVSHQSVLVFDVLSARAKRWSILEDMGIPLVIEGLPQDMSAVYEELCNHLRAGDYKSAFDCAGILKAEGTRLFKLGQFSLERRAVMDKIFDTLKSLLSELEPSRLSDADIDRTEGDSGKELARDPATYHINLSVFKSLPDSWAIGQLFPFAPLHHLEEEPTVPAIFSDLTCDSDGKVSTFIGHGGDTQPSNHLRLHPLPRKKPYYVGMFLAGAYQEVLGSMHNLFGMPNILHVSSNSRDGDGFQITRSLRGQTVGAVLRVMQHNPDHLLDDLRARVADSLVAGRFKTEQEAVGVLNNLACSFDNYTYLSNAFMHKPDRYTTIEQAYCWA